MGNSWVLGSVTGGESTFRWRSSPLFLSVIDSSDFRVQVKTLLVVISPLGQFLFAVSRHFSLLFVAHFFEWPYWLCTGIVATSFSILFAGLHLAISRHFVVLNCHFQAFDFAFTRRGFGIRLSFGHQTFAVVQVVTLLVLLSCAGNTNAAWALRRPPSHRYRAKARRTTDRSPAPSWSEEPNYFCSSSPATLFMATPSWATAMTTSWAFFVATVVDAVAWSMVPTPGMSDARAMVVRNPKAVRKPRPRLLCTMVWRINLPTE